MRKIALFLITLSALVSCKNENTEAQSSEEATETVEQQETMDPSYSGEFIYIDDAAVLKGPNYIYGVVLDDMANELRDRVATVKNEKYDMVPVVVRGKVTKNTKTDAWENVITITKIVSVSKTPAKADIKLEDKKK